METENNEGICFVEPANTAGDKNVIYADAG